MLGFRSKTLLYNIFLVTLQQITISTSVKEECIKTYSEIQDCMGPLLALCTESQRVRLLEAVHVLDYRKHELIYECGARPDHLLCMLSGKVKIYCDGVGGRSQIMRVLAPGEYFGYRAFLAQEPYVTAAAAFEASRIITVNMPLIHTLMEENNRVCLFFVRLLAADLGESDQRTVSLTQKHMRGRMAEAILYLEKHFGLDPEDGKTLAIQLTREELSEISNMTTANAIRTLSAFAAEGLITIHGRQLTIENHEELARTSSIG